MGVKAGGILEHSMREIDLLCLPTSIPDALDLDVTDLELSAALHVSDLTLPEGVETSVDQQLPVAHVALPKVEEEPVAEEAALEEGEAAPQEGESAPAADDETPKDE